MESEKEEEDSEEEMESSISKPRQQESVGVEAAESAAPALTKAQHRDLRRLKKLDRSWISGLLEP